MFTPLLIQAANGSCQLNFFKISFFYVSCAVSPAQEPITIGIQLAEALIRDGKVCTNVLVGT
jgi:hypothetical protein